MKIKKILLIDLCILGENGGGHAEFYFMNILSMLTQEYDLVYACCANNELLKKNIEKINIENTKVIDIEVKLIDKILRRFLMFIDSFLNKIPLKKYIKFASLINLITVRRIMSNLDRKTPVFFHHTDSMMPAVPVEISRFFFPKQWIGLLITPSYKLKITDGHEKSRLRFNAEKNFSLHSCKAILVLQPLYQRFLIKRFKHLNCLHLPEIINTISFESNDINQGLLNQIAQASQGKKIVSLLGNLTPRKNFPLFLESVSKLDLNKYFILVLGKLKLPQKSDQDLEKYNLFINELIGKQERLAQSSYIDINYFIKNENEFSALINLSDIVYLHYKNFPFSSNILTKVMAHGKPVIVDKGFIMQKTVNKFNWKTAVEGDAQSIATKIEELARLSPAIENQSILHFLQEHSFEKIKKILVQSTSYFN
ncbi:MAG: glycosyltransferase [Coleofasciculus sp. D1-CHI-01]|uniref:hypothetical protein n=1 Tax=Coleofasciculus sp. D1-CHI-01 TaxID=3068482 RepID=UPI0032F5A7C1